VKSRSLSWNSGSPVFKQLSKTDGRANRDLQIVLGSAIEINLIARICANPDRSEEEFNATTRVEGAIQVSVFETGGECPEGNWSRSYSEPNEAALRKQERTNRRVGAKLELRSARVIAPRRYPRTV